MARPTMRSPSHRPFLLLVGGPGRCRTCNLPTGNCGYHKVNRWHDFSWYTVVFFALAYENLGYFLAKNTIEVAHIASTHSASSTPTVDVPVFAWPTPGSLLL